MRYAMVLAMFAFAAAAQQPGSVLDDIVRQLGDEDFDTREEASRALVRLGEGIVPLLKTLCQDAHDPEIRMRLGAVIDSYALKAVVKQAVIGVPIRSFGEGRAWRCSVTLDGSPSVQANGTKELLYDWTLISGDPRQIRQRYVDNLSVSVTFFSAGTYTFSFVVSDGRLVSRPAYVDVTVFEHEDLRDRISSDFARTILEEDLQALRAKATRALPEVIIEDDLGAGR